MILCVGPTLFSGVFWSRAADPYRLEEESDTFEHSVLCIWGNICSVFYSGISLIRTLSGQAILSLVERLSSFRGDFL